MGSVGEMESGGDGGVGEMESRGDGEWREMRSREMRSRGDWE